MSVSLLVLASWSLGGEQKSTQSLLLSKPRLGLLQRKGILVVRHVGTHPPSLSEVHDIETALTLSVPCLFQMKAFELSDAIDALSCALVMGSLPSSRMDYKVR